MTFSMASRSPRAGRWRVDPVVGCGHRPGRSAQAGRQSGPGAAPKPALPGQQQVGQSMLGPMIEATLPYALQHILDQAGARALVRSRSHVFNPLIPTPGQWSDARMPGSARSQRRPHGPDGPRTAQTRAQHPGRRCVATPGGQRKPQYAHRHGTLAGGTPTSMIRGRPDVRSADVLARLNARAAPHPQLCAGRRIGARGYLDSVGPGHGRYHSVCPPHSPGRHAVAPTAPRRAQAPHEVPGQRDRFRWRHHGVGSISVAGPIRSNDTLTDEPVTGAGLPAPHCRWSWAQHLSVVNRANTRPTAPPSRRPAAAARDGRYLNGRVFGILAATCVDRRSYTAVPANPVCAARQRRRGRALPSNMTLGRPPTSSESAGGSPTYVENTDYTVDYVTA